MEATWIQHVVGQGRHGIAGTCLRLEKRKIVTDFVADLCYNKPELVQFRMGPRSVYVLERAEGCGGRTE